MRIAALCVCLGLMGFMTTSFTDEKPIKYFTYEASGFGWADTTANGIFGYIEVDAWKPYTDVEVRVKSAEGQITLAPDSTGMFGMWGFENKYSLTVLLGKKEYPVKPDIIFDRHSGNRAQLELTPVY
jgi:hypothetical protein